MTKTGNGCVAGPPAGCAQLLRTYPSPFSFFAPFVGEFLEISGRALGKYILEE